MFIFFENVGILGHLTVWDDVGVMSLIAIWGLIRIRLGGLLYIGRMGERTFQQEETARAGTSRHSEAPSGEMSDGVHLTVILGRPSKTLNASAYHFRVLFLPLVYSYSLASRFFSRVYPEIVPKLTSPHPHPHQQSGRTEYQDGYWIEYE